MGYLTYDQWFSGLDADTKAKATALIAKMKALGASEAEAWVRSEIQEDIPQVMRYLVLRLFAREVKRYDDGIDNLLTNAQKAAKEGYGDYTEDAGHALQRMEAAGISKEHIKALVMLGIYEGLFAFINVLDEEGDYEHRDLKGWMLMEFDHDEFVPTGRLLNLLHESLLQVMQDQGLRVKA